MGIFDKIKNALSNSTLSNSTLSNSTVSNPTTFESFEDLFSNFVTDIDKSDQNCYCEDFKQIPTYQEILKFDDKLKVEVILFLIDQIQEYLKNENQDYITNLIKCNLIISLFKEKIIYEDVDIQKIAIAFIANKNSNHIGLANFFILPVKQFVTKIASQFKGKKLNHILKTAFEDLRNQTDLKKEEYRFKDKLRITEKIDSLVFEGEKESEAIKPVLFLEGDVLSDYANPQIKNLPEDEKVFWYKLLTEARKATGAKPTAKFLSATEIIVNKLGVDKYKQLVNEWFAVAIQSKDVMLHQEYYATFAVSTPNTDTLKGLVWMCSHFNDSQTIYKISKLAERCYQKIPGKGPAAPSLGNACLFTLYKTEGLEGISQLSRLKLRIKQNNTQGIIEKYLNQAADEQGISVYEIEDLAADDFDLSDGKRTWEFDDYKAQITLLSIGKVETKWIKADGNLQKTVPTFVKEKYATQFTELKNIVKQVEQNSSSQRDRIDRMFRSARTMSWKHFDTYYLSHGLISYMAKKIIWNFTEKDTTISAIYRDGIWKNYSDEIVNPSESCLVSLWHPSLETTKGVTNWRDFLNENKIQQPLKQAFREVYLLTEAEVNTRSYSNRMAAHILKQHQFNTLAKTRGWKYSLLGCYDDGRENEIASLDLKEYKLRAEFWVNEVNADEQYNDTGIWNYVATDQVRFTSTENNEVVDLIHVPAQVFSEIMRDVDLFVGVASVGNDPTWQDTGGIPAYRDYWQSYSFGDLSEVAKMRKDILINLVPRLKISSVAEVKDKFLVVQGKLRIYKIHIGSTNILMEPNDQYLCIVADRSVKNHTDNLFLPFEGDTGLSIILSKAFLLADDDKITDTTITSQINRK